MDTRRIEWDEDRDFLSEQVRSMTLKKYNNLLDSGRWSTKEPKGSHILALVGVTQKLMNNSNKTSGKSDR